MTRASHRARQRRRVPRLLVGVVGVAVLGVVAFGAQPANAVTKHNTGWHEVCARSLTFKTDDGKTLSLTTGDYVNALIVMPSMVHGKAYRYIAGPGWTYLGFGEMQNGWFC